jgi:hypothetical protein
MSDLDSLLAKQEITEVLFTYCRGVDRLDEALVRGIYHEESYDDHGYWKGRGQDFGPFVIDRLREANVGTTHSITNILINLDGDVAVSESQVMVTLRRRGEDNLVDVMGARYVDRFSKRQGRWKIEERTVVLDWHKVETWLASAPPIALDDFAKGKRDQSDPIYIMLSKGRLGEPSSGR